MWTDIFHAKAHLFSRFTKDKQLMLLLFASFLHLIHYLPSSALLAPLVGHGACNRRSTANDIQNSGFLLPFLTRKSITFVIQFKGSIMSSKWNLMGQSKIVHADYSSLA
jgi:hypothetical protein